jgi:hypothetical protein
LAKEKIDYDEKFLNPKIIAWSAVSIAPALQPGD